MAKKQAVAQATIAELVEMIVKRIVDNPNQVRVNEVPGSRITVIEVSVKKEDVGQIIGKKGSFADAIRVILNAASGKDKIMYQLEILD